MELQTTDAYSGLDRTSAMYSLSIDSTEEKLKFNSNQFIYVQNLTAQRPITKLAQAREWEE
jgi:hypothetical protein